MLVRKKKQLQSEQLLYFVGITFTVISLPATSGGQIFLPFFKIAVPKHPFQGRTDGGFLRQIAFSKNFLRFRGCNWPLSVGISEGTFWASRIKTLYRKNFFQNFCKNRVRFGFSIPNKWRIKFFLKKIFEKSSEMGVHFDPLCPNEWRGLLQNKKFLKTTR